MAERRSTKKKAQEEREISVVWEFPEDLVSGYASNMLVQATDQEFYVSFFEIPPPVMLSPADIGKIENVRAECIARIIIAPERMAKFIEVMKQQLDAFDRKKAGKGGSSGTK